MTNPDVSDAWRELPPPYVSTPPIAGENVSESKSHSYFWPCLFLYFIWLQSCSINDELHGIRKALEKPVAVEQGP